MTAHTSTTDDDDLGGVATAGPGETGLLVSETPGPGADSIICTLRAPHEPASVGKVRKEVVADLQQRDLPEQLIDEAEIVASELLTNAVRHARPLSDGTIRVRWKIRGDVVEVEVTDGGGENVPRPAPRSVWLSSGRGLRIVRSVAHEWGVTEDRTGNVVWATLGGPSRRRAT
ncbi:ATP-binding protein [Oryzobacter sp. R7]|uniref:ATP-binding protein n=1 Tax=Oryzobacter faecalis TaxID=3388656 RepID=UPI00398D48A7